MDLETKKYVKSFSKGQITVPKEFREKLGLGDIFWLKLSMLKNKIIAEPVDVDTGISKADYSEQLLGINGNWFSDKDGKRLRMSVEKRLKENAK